MLLIIGIADNIDRVAALLVLATVMLVAGCNRTNDNNASTTSKEPYASIQGPPAIRPDSNDSIHYPGSPSAKFTEIGDQAGISFQYKDGNRGLHEIMEANGGGLAVFDFDADGTLDIFFTQGCPLPVDASQSEPASPLFRQLTPDRFASVQHQAFLLPVGYLTGCAVGDFNADGFSDLFVGSFGRNYLYLNNGDGTFHDWTENLGAHQNHWTTSAAFSDLNGDGFDDLFVVNYVVADDSPPILCPQVGSPDGYVQCSPVLFRAAPDHLFWNSGDGKFDERGRDSGITANDGKGLGIVTLDFDQDGDIDIFIANDGTPNFLYINQLTETDSQTRQPRFYEEAALRGCAVNADGEAEASMGVAFGDWNRDGWTDLHCTHFFAESNTLYENKGDGYFHDGTRRAGLSHLTRQLMGWGTIFLDADQDGWLDLFVANGHIDDYSWAPGNEPFAMRPQLFMSRRGQLLDSDPSQAGPYFERDCVGRGVAAGDLDGDGDVDLAISDKLTKSVVLRNDTAAHGKWVSLRLVGQFSSRTGIGASVAVQKVAPAIRYDVAGGGSFQSASDYEVLIGLGDETSTTVTLEITWPSGAVDRLTDLKIDSRYVAIEGGTVIPNRTRD